MGVYSPENELIPMGNWASTESILIKSIAHYTSIPTFLKILQTKCFRFNRIDNVNDLEEKEFLQQNDNYRRTFISCFTDYTRESIPMWKIYTTPETGIMLKIKFSEGHSVDELFEKNTMYANTSTVFPIDSGNVKKLMNSAWRVKLSVGKISYTDKRIPTCLHVKEENKYYDIPDYFGLEKRTAWKYERELRYRAIIRAAQVNTPAEFEEIGSLFGKINFSAIDKITVVFNPWINKEEWVSVLKAAIKEQKIDTQIDFRNSSLYKKIR